MENVISPGDMLEESFAFPGPFSSYFSFSRRRSGYSGVATFCAQGATPIKAEEGLAGTLPSAAAASQDGGGLGCLEGLEDEFSAEDLRSLDSEGRAVLTRHKTKGKDIVISAFIGFPQYDSMASKIFFFAVNVYCPRADPEVPEREAYQVPKY